MDNKLLLFVLVSSIACVDFIQAGVLDRETNDVTTRTANDRKSQLLEECGLAGLVFEPTIFLDQDQAEKFVRKAKCITSCLLKKVNLVTDDNKLNKTVVDKIDPKEVGQGPFAFKCIDDGFYDKCSHVTDRDECDYAFKVMECFKSVCERKNK